MAVRRPHQAITEVFRDPSGRRWVRAKRWTFFIIAAIALLVCVSWGPIQVPPALVGKPEPPPLPELGRQFGGADTGGGARPCPAARPPRRNAEHQLQVLGG